MASKKDTAGRKKLKWRDVTDTFSEEARHYSDVYLEICEVYDDKVEVNLYSSETGKYEIYVSYGRMYGIVYVDKEEATAVRDEIKEVLAKEYEISKEPSGDFINSFAEKYKLDLPNDIFFNWNPF